MTEAWSAYAGNVVCGITVVAGAPRGSVAARSMHASEGTVGESAGDAGCSIMVEGAALLAKNVAGMIDEIKDIAGGRWMRFASGREDR